jgi:4-carboxymuconolactone decarboxylase
MGNAMADDERRKRGMKYFDEVYGGIVPFPVEALHDDFLFNTVDQLFSEVWSRPQMSIRDRRLFVMGMIAAQAEADTFEIQVRAALHKGELSPADIRELAVILPYYVGYPRGSRMRAVTQKVLAEIEKKPAS